ncbi:NADH dehydrogenase [Meinhardsimonia xiamenensis]|jgi:NADH dehydrogenase|uniref:NADH dehydrogenase n=1 Tax=Meinhardsimonia xiamenensis TaxID=990712 RepID=A0A1G8Z3Y4_9RHOB|nr:complex I NDUFA9 subunit family protein [Meinhardsimonia xiamenensis]PRX37546.1 NADH dehydrogenase [Meinhardsimonia xiamenensis]SDK09832.1 NADH dehydrogenase [Meinhardsimonia xiamenensis]
MSRLVTVFGGSGFIGRYITERLAEDGWRIRVAVRRPNEALFTRTYGVPGQIEPVFANIRDEASVRLATRSADAVVNCVGVLTPSGANSFSAVHDEGAGRVARIAAEEGVERVVHVSALGADPQSPSLYARTKAAGEAAVLAARPDAVILRPSVVFGPEDQFFNRFAAMARMSPVIPVFGARTRFQPVYVEDVAAAAVNAIDNDETAGVYELGGPEIDDFAGLMRRMLDVIERRRLILPLPFWAGAAIGGVSEALSALTIGLLTPPVTRDQIRLLRRDNVVSETARGLIDLGVTPTPMEAVLPEYLWPYRPLGQYAAIRDSARRLRARHRHGA